LGRFFLTFITSVCPFFIAITKCPSQVNLITKKGFISLTVFDAKSPKILVQILIRAPLGCVTSW
jgi:hypothetical protein